MKLLTIASVLSTALFAGCAALPAGSDGYAGGPYYSASADYGSPAYYAAPTYYDPPAYYAAPAYYVPSFGVSTYGGPRGGEWNRDRVASGRQLHQNRQSYVAPLQVAATQPVGMQGSRAARGMGSQPIATQAGGVQEIRVPRGLASQAATPQAVGMQGRRGYATASQPTVSRVPPAQVNRGAQAASSAQGQPSRGTAQRGREHVRG
jgi:hypothetical protein